MSTNDPQTRPFQNLLPFPRDGKSRERGFHNKEDGAPAGPPLRSWDQVSIQATLTRGGGALPGQRAPAARLALELSREPATSPSE